VIDKLKAAEEVRKFLRTLEGLTALSQELQETGSMEQAANEARSRLEAGKAEEVKLKAQLVSIKAEVSKANGTLVATKAEAERITANANKGAQTILEDARAKACEEDIACEARKKEAAALVERYRKQADAITFEISSKTKEFEQVKATIQKAKEDARKALA